SRNLEIENVVRENAPLNHQLTSPTIQREIIKDCASETINVIISDIGDKFFSLLVDETRDCSVKEQMAIVLRYVIDRIGEEISSRFGETIIELLICIASLDPRDSFSHFSESKLHRLTELYPQDFLVRDLYDLKMVEVGLHNTFCLVYRLIELALVLHVATATVERAFSAMNIVKTNLCNKKGGEFLTNSLVCYVEKDVFKSIDNEVNPSTFFRI
ncbi:hypothetical protein V2J09_003161, partial [Rumex salicifolius]